MSDRLLEVTFFFRIIKFKLLLRDKFLPGMEGWLNRFLLPSDRLLEEKIELASVKDFEVQAIQRR